MLIFRRIAPSSLLIGGALLFGQSAAVSKAQVRSKAIKPDLSGRVVTKDGTPIPNASVLIYTAAPRVGLSAYCPYCYADCAKRVLTTANDDFRISSLDPSLIFNVLVLKNGMLPTFQREVDPRRGNIQITLSARPVDAAPRHVVSGRVLGRNGLPVAGAKVTPVGIEYPDGHGSVGAIEDADPVSVTDEQGIFQIQCKQIDVKLQVMVEARGLASGVFGPLESGKPAPLQLTSGATVRGQVLKQGKPLPNVILGLVQVNREVETFFGPMTIGTDSHGRFQFENVPPNQTYFLYGTMQGMRGSSAIACRKITVGADGSEVDAGPIPVGPAHGMKGHVVLTDGNLMPMGTRLIVNRIDAWDTQIIDLPITGNFAVTGLPEEPVQVSVSIPGYRVAARNTGFTSTDPDWLTITPSDMKQTIKIEMTPAK